MHGTVTAILAGTPLESEVETAIAQLSSPEIRSFLHLDPADYFSKINIPVLALNGERDLQVPFGPNLDGFRNGLVHNARATIRSYPGLNHLFQHAETGNISEYGTIEETISPEVLTDIAEWILGVAKQ